MDSVCPYEANKRGNKGTIRHVGIIGSGPFCSDQDPDVRTEPGSGPKAIFYFFYKTFHRKKKVKNMSTLVASDPKLEPDWGPVLNIRI
jgi:hypothetical protein